MVDFTHCDVCHQDIPYTVWVSDVCPTKCLELCPIFECESFRYADNGRGSLVKCLSRLVGEIWVDYEHREENER